MTNMTNETEKTNRDFERRGVYTPPNYNNYYNYNRENKFRFKNSLVITPFYETEFNVSGGIKYIRNHDGCVFFTDDSIFATTNNIQKLPVLIKRGINKQSVQKKLIVGEKYNYEEKYEIYKNIILYYDENRIDFQIIFNKSEQTPTQNIKDITTEFSLNLFVPGINQTDSEDNYDNNNNLVTYKKFSEKSDALEYLIIRRGKRSEDCMTIYPDKRLTTEYKNKSLRFITSNLSQPQKNYINLKIYLENYRIT